MGWFTETETGLRFDNDHGVSFQDFEEAWIASASEISRKQWKIGDLWNYGERRFHEEAFQVIDDRKVSKRRIQTFAWVCRKFSGRRRGLRSSDLSFYHHEAVAGLIDDPEHPEWTEQASVWLEEAVREGLSVDSLEERVNQLRAGMSGGFGPNPLQMLQTALGLCDEALPLVEGQAQRRTKAASANLREAVDLLRDEGAREAATRPWFPNPQEAEA